MSDEKMDAVGGWAAECVKLKAEVERLTREHAAWEKRGAELVRGCADLMRERDALKARLEEAAGLLRGVLTSEGRTSAADIRAFLAQPKAGHPEHCAKCGEPHGGECPYPPKAELSRTQQRTLAIQRGEPLPTFAQSKAEPALPLLPGRVSRAALAKPPCPTCGGMRKVDVGDNGFGQTVYRPCPDCAPEVKP